MGVGDVVIGADVVLPSPPAAAKNAVADEVVAVGAEVVPTTPPWPPATPLRPPVSALPSPGPPRSGPMAPLTSTMTTGGLPSGVCMAPKLITSSSATVVAAGDRSLSWMAASSAVSSAGATAGASHDAAVEEEAASSLLLLRRRTAVDADVDVGVEERADTAATTLACSSADQLPTSAANSSLPSDANTSATLVAEEAIDETGVDAMSPDRRKGRRGGGKRKCDGADKLRSVGYMFILTCSHVLHHNFPDPSHPQKPLFWLIACSGSFELQKEVQDVSHMAMTCDKKTAKRTARTENDCTSWYSAYAYTMSDKDACYLSRRP